MLLEIINCPIAISMTQSSKTVSKVAIISDLMDNAYMNLTGKVSLRKLMKMKAAITNPEESLNALGSGLDIDP